MPCIATRQLLRNALLLHSQGKLPEAEKLYLRTLEQHPGDPDALHLLGVLCNDRGRGGDALGLIERAIAIRPDVARYHSDLGNALCGTGRISEAIRCHECAIRLEPSTIAYHVNLGAALRDAGESLRAIEAYKDAVALDPRFAQAYNNLGVVLADEGRLDEAIASFHRAIEIDRNYADAHTNLGVTLYANRRAEESVAHCRRAVELNPDFAKAHSNLALILLGTGHFPEGWIEHEWRWKCNPAFKPRPFSQPQWSGEPLASKTILLHAEQGFGDAIQFARYVPLIARRAKKVIVECPPALARLFQSLEASATVIPSGHLLPPFDTHCSLMSLPYALGDQTIPAEIPYVRPGSSLVHAWRGKLRPTHPRQIGIAWAGRPTHSNDRNRSMSSEHLSLLARLPGIEWHSLLKNPTEGIAPRLHILDHSSDLNDFADTAAFIANLDLVISVDTAVAHLAGAMGRPIWLLLPFAAEWRWMLNRDDSPWYSTMRLFRQERWGDWAGVMHRVADTLQSHPWPRIRQ
jgi:tetratricopeptide (TPR) repeat protein